MQDESFEEQRCPFCHANDHRPWWPRHEHREFRVCQCQRCDLVYTIPSLSASAMTQYYDAPYYGTGNVRFNVLFERLITWFRNRRARRLRRYISSGRVLDVGCGRGYVLAALREYGFQVQGIELSELAVQHAREVLGLNVTVGGFDPDQYPDQSFDAVIFWHVLEHLPDVAAALQGALRILKPGGMLVIAVPNLASWQARLTGSRWFHLDLPRHYSHFSDRWLRHQLGELGLQIREVNHFSFEQNPYGWIQSLLNCTGLRQNLLYDLLKSTSARSIRHPLRQYPLQSACSLCGLAALLPLASAMLLPETLFGRGGTVEVYAQRPAKALAGK